MSRFLAFTLTLWLASTAAAADNFDAGAAAKTIAPFLDDRTLVVAHVDLTRLQPEAIYSHFVILSGIKEADLGDMKKDVSGVATGLDAFRRAGGSEAFLVFSLIDLIDGPFVVIPGVKETDVKAMGEVLKKLTLPDTIYAQVGGAIVVGPRSVVTRVKGLKATDRPELAKALAFGGDAVARVALIPNADSRKVLEETSPTLPTELGGGAMTTLTKGLQWACLAISAAPEVKGSVVIQSPDADSAKALQTMIGRVLSSVKALKDFPKETGLDKTINLLAFKADGDRLTLTVSDKDLATTLAPDIVKIRAAAARSVSTNNLKQIAIAMHIYYDANKHFPAYASFDKAKKPLLSWRVHILPYLEQDALYKEFKLDEPWDSEHNKKLIARMPATYNSTGNKKLAAEGKTTYLVPRGDATMFPGENTIKFTDVTDGTSNTIFLVDADDKKAVFWTSPEDLTIDPNDAAAGLSKRFGGAYLLAFVDGSVHFMKDTISKEDLYPYFTRNSGIVRKSSP